jgi:NAD(P)-dependent dehydrogenase (short-subunit alcohol dehydrogenase family)
MTRALTGRSAIITGASQGFGKAVAKTFVEAGASVILCARDADLLEKTRQEIEHYGTEDQRVLALPADVTSQADVDSLIQTAYEQLQNVCILVNNAGVYGPKGEIDSVDWLDWMRAIEINLYGTILPIRIMLPRLKAAGYGKIINLSGGGATNPLPRLSAYAASKAAVVRFTETLAEEVRGTGIDVNALAPGALNTRLLDEVIQAGAEKVGQAFYERSLKQRDSGGVPLETGAALCEFLASAASDGITGKLLSAVWDPWKHLPEHLDELNHSDIYTLRRIVPKDRSMDWGD